MALEGGEASSLSTDGPGPKLLIKDASEGIYIYIEMHTYACIEVYC